MITTQTDVMATADATIYRGRWKLVTVEQSNPGYEVTVRNRDWDMIRRFTCDTLEAADRAARRIAA